MLPLGGLLICAAILVLAALALVFRSPKPPHWTTGRWAGELISVGLVALFALGLAIFVAGTASAYREGPQLLDLGLLAAVLLVALVIWRKLDLRARFRAMAADAGGANAPGAGPVATATEPPPSQPSSRVA